MARNARVWNILLWLTFFSLVHCTAVKPFGSAKPKHVPGNDWGMRIREMPRKPKLIEEPVVVQKAPAGEATAVVLASGVIKIYYINRPGEGDKLLSISSADNGMTWSRPATEFDLPGTAYHANNLVKDENGDLHAVFHIFGTGDNGYHGRQLNLWYNDTHGRDHVWSEPRKIYDGYVGSIRGFTELRNKRLLLAFAKAVPARVNKPPKNQVDYGWNDIISLYSDDQGKTWGRSNAIKIAIDGNKVSRYGGVEPSIMELRNGKVWMLIRTNTGRLYASYSDDHGTTWQPPQPTRFISSDSPADLLRLSDNRIVLFWCSDQRWDNPKSYANGGREVLHAAISGDEGKSWKGFREILTALPGQAPHGGDWGTAYPSAVETSDHKILLVSGQGGSESMVLFDPNWLEKRSASDHFSDGLVQWTLFGDSAIGLKPMVHDRGRDRLFICKPLAGNAGNEAVWNFPMTGKGKLMLRIARNRGNKGIQLTLTDHFSVSYDGQASQNGNVGFVLDGDTTGDIKVEISWDIQKKEASLSVNDKLVQEKPFGRPPRFWLQLSENGYSGEGQRPVGLFYQVSQAHTTKIAGD